MGSKGGELVHQMDVPRLEEPEIELERCSAMRHVPCLMLVHVSYSYKYEVRLARDASQKIMRRVRWSI